MEESERYGRDCPLEKKFRLEREGGGGKEGERGGGWERRKRGYCKANNGIESYAIPTRVSCQQYQRERGREKERGGEASICDENRLGMKMSV